MNHRSRSLAALTVFLAATGMIFPVFAQKIVNGSFERAGAEGAPEYWEVQPHELTVELDGSATNGDGQALKISGTDGSTFVKQEFELGESGFSAATLRGRIRTQGIAQSATLVATLEGPEGRVFLDDMRDRVVAGDTEWQEHRIYIPGSKEARSLTVGARVIGSGTAWFDDLELVEYRVPAPANMELRDYVLDAFGMMRENYLHRDEVDWDRVRQRGLEALPKDASTAQAHAAVWMMLEALDDPHVGINRPRIPDTDTGRSEAFEPVKVEMAFEGIAMIQVPSVPGATAEARTRFADDAHEQLKSIDSPEICGWIIDLRDNTGGNMWPMLAAIGPIVGPGVVGRFIGPDGGAGEWIYRNGASIASEESGTMEGTAVSVDPFKPRNPDLPVAVLISERTASSGEATTIAFIGREKTRLFGSETGGLATANKSFRLSDGGLIIFPVTYMADREGNAHFPRVQPDERVSPGDALTHAMKWLQNQPACGE